MKPQEAHVNMIVQLDVKTLISFFARCKTIARSLLNFATIAEPLY
jgi:hypothetical protein